MKNDIERQELVANDSALKRYWLMQYPKSQRAKREETGQGIATFVKNNRALVDAFYRMKYKTA